MTRTETPVLKSAGEKIVRACPTNNLKDPVRRFEDTFKAETVLMQAFARKA